MAGNRLPPARRIAVVLGGGGMKGFAHVGVLRALEESGVEPTVFAGTSIGAMIAAAYVGGMSLDAMAERATSLRKGDLFRINHLGMLMERMRAPSIYLGEPLRELVASAVPDCTFEELPRRLLVNTVDLELGTPMVWGLPGLRDVKLADAVYASCALPGYFPPGLVRGRLCTDGGVVDNLPVGIASIHADAVIAVDVGSSDLTRGTAVASSGFAAIYMRAATVMMHALQQMPLEHWQGPPMILIRPKVADMPWLSFQSTVRVIEEGYRAATEALRRLDECLAAPGGIYPRRPIRVVVDRDACTGCGLCTAQAPGVMGLDSSGKAFARTRVVEWSPADGGFVPQCPEGAIHAQPLDGDRAADAQMTAADDPASLNGRRSD